MNSLDSHESPRISNMCELCGEPMPPGEEMFKFHGYSGPCPKPPMGKLPTLPESNMLLRSAFEIANRNGKETNWEVFRMGVQKELLRQAGLPEGTTDEQLIARATCTARTYRLP